MGEVIKARKPKARHRDVVFGAIDERLNVLLVTFDTSTVGPHINRLMDLIDELKRSLAGKENGDE